MRQYVLAFPDELSGLAATRPEVLAALSRMFWQAQQRHYRAWAKDTGYAPSAVETGAVTGVHRAGEPQRPRARRPPSPPRASRRRVILARDHARSVGHGRGAPDVTPKRPDFQSHGNGR